MELNKIENTFQNNKTKLQPYTTIIFLHGNSMNSCLFENQFKSQRLSKYNLVAIDLPGHGDSEQLEIYTIPNVVEIILENIKKNKNIILAGHSLGGHIAIQLLPYLKANCIAICLISCCPFKIPLNTIEAYNFDETAAYLLQDIIPESTIDNLLDLIYEVNGLTQQKIKKSILKTHGKFRSDMAISLLNEELNDEVKILNEFTGKICLIIGSNDAFINGVYLKKLSKERLLKSKLHIIPDSGHSPHLNNPDRINSIIKNLID